MKRSHGRLALLLSLGLTAPILALAPAAEATIIKQLTLAEMARRADVVAHGTVVHQTATWNPEHTRIYTVTELRLTEAVKGTATPGESISIRQLGGVVGDTVQSIPGNAHFAVGEEVVVFLDKDESLPWHYVIGMAQGKFGVTPGAGVAQDVGDLAFVRPDASGALQPAAAAPVAPGASVADLKARIRAALTTP